MQTAVNNGVSKSALLNRISGFASSALLMSMSGGAVAAFLGDPYIPDPVGIISASDTAGNVWVGISFPNSTLDIQGGGTLTLDADKSIYVGVDTSDNSTTVVGSSNVSQALLSVPSDIYVGLNDSSDGNSMFVGDWGSATANRLVLGMNDNSSSNIFTASGATGSLQIAGDVYVGFNGDANRAIIDQGRDITVGGHVYLGVEAFSSGNSLTVSGSGSTLVSSQEMIIGFGGNTNTLTVEKSGMVTNRHTYMGYFSGADANSARVSDSGSVWRTNGVFYLSFASDNNEVTVDSDGQVIVGTGGGVPNSFTTTPDGAVRISAGRIGFIIGNYLQQPAGIFHIDASSTSNYGQLAVTGSATLQNGARIVVTVSDCDSIPVGSTLVSVLSATTSLSRSGITVSDNCPGVDFQAVQSGNAINLQAINPIATSIPTLSQWGMILLSGLLGIASLFAMRGRKG
jgi:T5SS/PEP-CTERM-associated repeat protein